MNLTEPIATLSGVLLGIIVVPWCAWVTASIFGLRTQTVLMAEQLKSIKNIEALVVSNLGVLKDGKRS